MHTSGFLFIPRSENGGRLAVFDTVQTLRSYEAEQTLDYLYPQLVPLGVYIESFLSRVGEFLREALKFVHVTLQIDGAVLFVFRRYLIFVVE